MEKKDTMRFEELPISRNILRALKDIGYQKASDIQELAIPPMLEGKDLVGCAQTGTGKTAAFAIPILERLLKSSKPQRNKTYNRKIRALILTPTRELAFQIFENMRNYSKYIYIRNCVIFGGVGRTPQIQALGRGTDTLIATPGRLLDLMEQGYIDLSSVEIFVLDEADRMLDMGFLPDVKKIIKKLPNNRQTALFSATMPDEISKLIGSILVNPVTVKAAPVSSTVDAISQSVYFVDKRNKTKLLIYLLKDLPDDSSTLVFTRTKSGAERLAKDLKGSGIKAQSIHGDKSQWERRQALSDFKARKIQVLVATDIAARGIDVDRLSHVFNYDIPEVAETYVHRIGRTGRAGKDGNAISFCSLEEKPFFNGIEKLIRKKIKVEINPKYSTPIPKIHTNYSVKGASPRRSVKSSKNMTNVKRSYARNTGDLENQFLQAKPSIKNKNEILDFARRQSMPLKSRPHPNRSNNRYKKQG